MTVQFCRFIMSNKYLSVTLTRIFMKTIGFWHVESRKEQFLLYVVLIYAILAIVFAVFVEIVDLYHSLNDFYALTYNLCATLLLTMILVKFGTFIYYRDILMKLIADAETYFWNAEYDESSSRIMLKYDRRAVLMTYSFTLIVQVATFNYLLAPVFENVGKNETDRTLPFKVWVDLPLTVSPYYEITYFIEILSTFHSGVCTFCFDNFVCTFNTHAAAQLEILAYRMSSLGEKYMTNVMERQSIPVEKIIAIEYNNLKKCVLKHLMLINFLEQMECAFRIILFGQLLLSSLIICFGGFQFLAAKVLMRKFMFAIYFLGTLSQLFLYTWTCNDIIVQSSEISDAAYNSKWYFMSEEHGKALKISVSMIIQRGRRPCQLTAGGFAVMSLETFTGILSTSMSYFTLLRQVYNEEDF